MKVTLMYCEFDIHLNIYISISVFLSTYRRFYRFLALKNLATVFLQQDSTHYENALRCYLQAVEIDSKDSVVWNRLGTLSCSMGSLSISRWAFEQGLLCSPNNCKHLILLDLNKSFFWWLLNGVLLSSSCMWNSVFCLPLWVIFTLYVLQLGVFWIKVRNDFCTVQMCFGL